MAYITMTDVLALGFPAAALAPLNPSTQQEVLDAASSFADSFFRARYGTDNVPFAAWDASVTRAVAAIAARDLLRIRGYNPASTADRRFDEAATEAIAWLEKVQRQQAHPKVTLAGNGTAPQQPKLTTSSVVDLSSGRTRQNRGW